MPTHCPGANKGTYVFESLPVVNEKVTKPGKHKPIELMATPSGEYGPDVLESLRHKPDRQAALAHCQSLHKAMSRQRAANSRRFQQASQKRRGQTGQYSFHDNSVPARAYIDMFNRHSTTVQTGLYLEELSEAIHQDDFASQTDDFLDRPATPMFIPAKTGADVATQIYDGDLFNFNLEVRPILEVLVGKTIEQALLEVLEEEELADLRKQQEQYEEIQNAAMADVARLEDRDRRYREEKDRRHAQSLEAMQNVEKLKKRTAAATFARAFLAPLLPDVNEQLLRRGYFYDAIEKDIEVNFLTPLIDTVTGSLDCERRARIAVDGLIREVVDLRHTAFRELGRSILENNVIVEIIPEFVVQVAVYTLEKLVRLAFSRLEIAANSVQELENVVANELIDAEIDDVAVEVQAQKEAEEAAANAEDHDSEY